VQSLFGCDDFNLLCSSKKSVAEKKFCDSSVHPSIRVSNFSERDLQLLFQCTTMSTPTILS